MNIISTYQRCAGVLVMMGITTFAAASFHENQSAPLLAVIGLPAAFAAWVLSVRGRYLLPRWAVNGLLTLALLYALIRLPRGVDVEVIAELVVFIQIFKIGDRRSPRDNAQILSLAVFLAIAAMLTSNAFWVGVQLIVFVPLLILTVMLFQLFAGMSGIPGANAAPGPAIGRSLRRVSFAATLVATAAAIFIFVIMPRGVGENALGNWRPALPGSVTGFTDHIKLGSRSVISASQRIVMEVTVRESASADGPPGLNLGNEETVYYLRGAVLDEYQNGAWAPSGGDDDSDRTRHLPPQRPPFDHDINIGQGAGAGIQQDISMRGIASARAPLFSIWRPYRLRVGRDTETIGIDLAGKTIRRNGRPGQFEYSVWSTTAESPASGEETRTPVSFDSKPIHDLAASILRAGGLDPDPSVRPVNEDSRAARLIESHLQHNYTYSLVEQAVPEGTDPTEYFLFQSREGHCEYFASAMAALCRSVGINARVVAGYVAAEFDASTGRYVIREANAHAWIEAEAGEGRWHRFDPTPPDDLTRIHRPVPSLLGRLRRAVESAEYAWNSSVVAFDESARQRLLGPDEEAHWNPLSRLDSVAERIRAAGPRHFVRSFETGLTVFVLVAVSGLLVQGLALLVSRLRWWPRWIPGRKSRLIRDPPQVRFYWRLLDLLARRGYAKPAWRPPLQHAAAMAPVEPELAELTERIAGLYYRARFAGKPLSEAERAAAAAAVDHVAHSRGRGYQP